MSRNETTAALLTVCLGLAACDKDPAGVGPEPATPTALEAVTAAVPPRASYATSILSIKPGFAQGINTGGQVVGFYSIGAFASQGFLWQNGVFRNIGTLGGPYSRALAINVAGQVVGWSTTANGPEHAFLWQNGVMRDLGTLGWTGGGFAGEATGINSKGQVVGWSLTAAGDHRAFLWEAGRMRRLTGLENVVASANGIDASRRVAGVFGSSTVRGFRWNGAVASIGTFGGDSSIATAINDQGKVVGWARMSTGAQRAFLWQNGAKTNLGTLGGLNSRALAINGLGYIVGESEVAGSRHLHAFLWKNGVMYNLGPGSATGINENGWVVGYKYDPGTTNETLLVPALWKPVATPPPPPPAGLVKIGNGWFGSVRNSSWNPAVDTVAVGRTVTWEMTRDNGHNVQSVGLPSFTSSPTLTGRGTKYAFKFTKAGTYQYKCRFHRIMTGTVVVR